MLLTDSLTPCYLRYFVGDWLLLQNLISLWQVYILRFCLIYSPFFFGSLLLMTLRRFMTSLSATIKFPLHLIEIKFWISLLSLSLLDACWFPFTFWTCWLRFAFFLFVTTSKLRLINTLLKSAMVFGYWSLASDFLCINFNNIEP